MKKIIMAAALALSVCAAQAQQTKQISVTNYTDAFVKTTCIEGYVFAVAVKSSSANAASSGIALTQVLKVPERRDWPPQPIECKENK